MSRKVNPYDEVAAKYKAGDKLKFKQDNRLIVIFEKYAGCDCNNVHYFIDSNGELRPFNAFELE